MWRKPNEAKPSQPQSYSAPVPTPVKSEEPVKPPAPAPMQAAPSFAAPSMNSSPASSSSNLSRISAGLKIQGDVSGDTDLYIDGEIQGKIRMTNGRVTVGPNGRVQAEIEARQISVDGTVQGNLKASESAQLGSSSKVVGSVTSPRIGIADGASLRGKIETVRAPQSPRSNAIEGSATQDQHEIIGVEVE
jgi:cytoskeletal protein CcmA (bactofilin family)